MKTPAIVTHQTEWWQIMLIIMIMITAMTFALISAIPNQSAVAVSTDGKKRWYKRLGELQWKRFVPLISLVIIYFLLLYIASDRAPLWWKEWMLHFGSFIASTLLIIFGVIFFYAIEGDKYRTAKNTIMSITLIIGLIVLFSTGYPTDEDRITDIKLKPIDSLQIVQKIKSEKREREQILAQKLIITLEPGEDTLLTDLPDHDKYDWKFSVLSNNKVAFFPDNQLALLRYSIPHERLRLPRAMDYVRIAMDDTASGPGVIKLHFEAR